MRILMIAPQPFFEPRGVPFSVYYHIKALGLLGHQIDLVTYAIGQQMNLPGLTIYRTPALPFVRAVKVGPSLAKFPLDLLVLLTALWRLGWRRYACIYTHEEAGLMGVILAALFRCKHLYYMHSDLEQQTRSSGFTKSRILLGCISIVQKVIMRQADTVITICPDLERTARRLAPHKPIHLIENVAVDEELPPGDPERVAELRKSLRLGSGPVLLYTGTLEPYQGIDLLLRSLALIHKCQPKAHVIIVGGQPEQIEALHLLATELCVSDVVHFVGQRPFEEMPHYMALADVLLSPRSRGTNTPLKLYTYLRSGKPVLATAILSHTQVISDETALLVSPTAQGLADGALHLLEHPEQARELGERGRRFAQAHFSWPIFFARSRRVYEDFAALCR